MNPAHPRSRGENLGVSMGALTVMGSSPLTRGKPDWRTRSRCWARLIPAHAGKTVSPSSISSLLWAHPRSRGENCFSGDRPGSAGGSSPLTRGKHSREDGPAGHPRLIPAHAGKTFRPPPRSGNGEAHPRSRGENRDRRRYRDRSAGSSPLTRGKHVQRDVDFHDPGLIPAHAGKTPGSSKARQLSRAHPRSRGENSSPSRIRSSGLGSSPLTRGKRAHWEAQTKRLGLIPAHAGKTYSQPWPPSHPWAHPRSRGENWWRPVARGLRAGSSPLTRGKHARARCASVAAGLIPAHAGKTSRRAGRAPTSGAHPRSRGENPRRRRVRRPRRGLIPAHAGKTRGLRQSTGGAWAHPRSRGENTS